MNFNEEDEAMMFASLFSGNQTQWTVSSDDVPGLENTLMKI